MAEPISLDEAKQHLRVVVLDDDDLIARLITAARQMVEGRTNSALVPRDEVLALDCWPAAIVLQYPPYEEVTSIKYTDPTGAEQTLAPADYKVNSYTTPVRIARPVGVNWPTTISEEAAIRVSYKVGYTTPDDVPAPLKQWMLLAIGSMYESREQFVTGTIVSPLPDDFMSLLLQPYVVYA